MSLCRKVPLDTLVRRLRLLVAPPLLLILPCTLATAAQDHRTEVAAPVIVERVVGPYDVHVLAGGPALTKSIPAGSRVLEASGDYTLSVWLNSTTETPPTTLLVGLGDQLTDTLRSLGLRDGRLMIRYGPHDLLIARTAVPITGWHLLAASSKGGSITLSVDGHAVAQGVLLAAQAAPHLVIAPRLGSFDPTLQPFGGDLVQVQLRPESSALASLESEAKARPDLQLLHWQDSSQTWPVQTHQQAGYLAPQDPSLMPASLAPFAKGVAKPLPPGNAVALEPVTAGQWALRSRWKLAAAPGIAATGTSLSTAGFADASWMAATVPGTVLTTMIDRGIYPDPDFGLNNLAIPESLNKQDYWYRIEFPTPAQTANQQLALNFLGINYAAEVWLNGHRLGDVRGAFLRGQFDITGLLRAEGINALAVRVSPPPHPGIPQEQSIKGGPGENGGAMVLDGPTFVATEGWDWIPAIRDRNTGIWQDVLLTATGTLQIGDVRVITHLPLPDISTADVSVDVPLHNSASQPVAATLHVAFEGVVIDKPVNAIPGDSIIHLDGASDPQLHLVKPRLWWPNGYGRPDLYHLQVAVGTGSTPSDHKESTFGVREITYELSLFDAKGHLRREEVAPTVAHQLGIEAVDVRHQAMRQTTEYWAPSLAPGAEQTAAVKPVLNEPDFTDLVLKVNGVRIAARGGNWGMDDSRKRVSREHLEPFFRLHREAHLNIIRNWVGQNTEQVFYDLADEYGLMVWNDFWESTQDYNAEAEDVPLFLANARDVVRRFRNHPSIVIWCARNEGVPQPILNEGLISLLKQEDGTRYYTPGSNRIDLRNSGPYLYQDPSLYYTTLDKGFSVELGISSLSTLESLRASIAPADQWPVSDAWAYHDWHQSGNGDVHPLIQHMEEQFGAATSLEDFERKAQMFNYVDHRAIFEGFNQHLFSPNSGRMLWMTQPAWPSNSWQILSSDYDTQASFYGVKKACESLHLQLDLSDYSVTAINTTGDAAPGLHAQAVVYDLAGKQMSTRDLQLDLASNQAVPLFTLQLAPYFARQQAVLVRLQLTDARGEVVSRNIYWLAGREADYRALATMPAAQLAVTAVRSAEADIAGESTLVATVRNTGTTPALEAKLTLVNSATHERILPAYYSDNYVSLLPGESIDVTIHYPALPGRGKAALPELTLRGWNVPNAVISPKKAAGPNATTARSN